MPVRNPVISIDVFIIGFDKRSVSFIRLSFENRIKQISSMFIHNVSGLTFHHQCQGHRIRSGNESWQSPIGRKWWLVKVVTRARVRFQIRIFFITSLLRH